MATTENTDAKSGVRWRNEEEGKTLTNVKLFDKKTPIVPTPTVGQRRAAEAAAAAATTATANQPSLQGFFPGQNIIEEENAAPAAPAYEQPRTNAPNAAELPKPPKPTLGQTRRRQPYGQMRAESVRAEKAAAQATAQATAQAADVTKNASNNGGVEANDGTGNNTNSEKNSISTEERQTYNAEEEQEEEPGPLLKTASGDPSLPHILKIGQSSFAEYITLKQISIETTGQFNALQTGSKEVELVRKYGIDTDEGIAAMQRAFGVRNQHQTPPIFGYIEKGCIPKGFDRVRKALEMRLDTLSVNIDAAQGSMSANPMKQRQRWIEDILEKTRGLSEMCQEPTGPSANAVKKPVATSGCPCLDELALLRNLTYIISFLTGTTDPQVKQQLEKITLQRMLTAVKKGNTNQASKILKDIIGVLEAYINNPSQKNIQVNDTRVQTILKPIYETIVKLHDKSNNVIMMPREITINDIMGELNKVIGVLETSQKGKAECDRLNERIQELQRELAEERGRGAESTAAAAASQQQIAALQEGLEAFAVSLQDAQTELTRQTESARNAQATIQQIRNEMAEQIRALQEIIQRHEQTIQDKDGEIQGLQDDMEDGRGHTASLQEIITRLTAEKARLLEAHEAALAETQRQLEEKEAELQTLREQLTAATAESAEKSGQQEIVAGHLQTLTDSVTRCEDELKKLREEKAALEATNRDLSERLSGLETQLAEVKAALEGSQERGRRDEERIQELEEQIADLRQQLSSKTAEKTATDTELEGLRARIIDNGNVIQGLERRVSELSDEKAQVDKDLEAEKEKCAEADAAKADYEKEKAELERQLGELRSLEGNLRAELATVTAEGQSNKSEKEALERELASALAKIASLEAALEQATSKSAASQTKMDEAHKAELAALQSELDQTKAEVERIKGIAAQEREALIRAQEEEIAGKRGEIEGLEKQLESAIQTAADKGRLEADLARKNAELEAAKSALADLQAELALRPTKANLDQRNAKLAEKDAEILEKEAKIKDLEAKLTTLEGEFDALRGEKDTLLSGLAAAQDAAESMISAEEGAKKDAEIEKLKEALAHASSVVDAQGAALAEAQGAREATKERLNILLGHLLINPDLRDQAHAFLNGDDTAIEPMKRDLCDLYGYLTNIINLQMRKIDSTGLPKEAKEDIFSVFKNMPAYDSRQLLSEINSIFQELFVQVAQTSTIPEELLLKKEYPELTKSLGSYSIENGQPLKLSGTIQNAFIVELGTFGYMSSVYIEPRPGNFFVLKKRLHTTPFDFANKNTTHMTPLVILGIKMIQSMAALLKEKYSDLARRCEAPVMGVEVQSREATPVPEAASVVNEDPLALAKREFDSSVSQLTSNLLMQHIMKYTNILNDPKAMLGADKLKHFPKHIAYAVLLSNYSHHLTDSNPRLQLRTAIMSKTDVLDAVIRKLELDKAHPEYADLIRRARE